MRLQACWHLFLTPRCCRIAHLGLGSENFEGFFVIPSVTYFLFFVLIVFTSHGPCESNSLSLSKMAWDFLGSESYWWMDLEIFGEVDC